MRERIRWAVDASIAVRIAIAILLPALGVSGCVHSALPSMVTVTKHPDGTRVWLGLFRVKPPAGPGWQAGDVGSDGILFTKEGDEGGVAMIKAIELSSAITNDTQLTARARHRCVALKSSPNVTEASAEISTDYKRGRKCILCRQQFVQSGPPGQRMPPVVQKNADWLCVHPRMPDVAVSILYSAQAPADEAAAGKAAHLGAPFDEAAGGFFAGFRFED